MPRRRISETDKERIINAFNNGEDYVQTAALLGIGRTTAWGIVRRFQQTGLVVRPRGGARNLKVDEEMISEMMRTVEERAEYTLVQINAALRATLPHKPHITESTIAKTLKNRFVVLKKLETVPQARNRSDVLEDRKLYGEWLLNIVNGVNPRELIFVDESGFNLFVTRTRGRAPVGSRAVRVVGGSRGPNFTFILGVSNQRGLIHHEFYQGGTTAVRFNEWLQSASSSAGVENRVTFIFDNAPCHLRVHDLELPDTHEVKFLPAYSPFLNIAENSFSVWKAAVKRQMSEVRYQLAEQSIQQKQATLLQIASQNLSEITVQNCSNSFRKTTTYIPSMLQLFEINEHQ